MGMLVLALIISLVAYIIVLIAKRLKQAEQQKQLELETGKKNVEVKLELVIEVRK